MPETNDTIEVEHKITKKGIILDSQVLTTLMSCARLTDYRFNLHLQPLNGKSKSLEMGSIVHKILEVFYQNQIKGFKRDVSIQGGFAAGMTFIAGCKHCSDFIPTDEQPKPVCGHQIDEYPGVSLGDDDIKTTLDTMEQYFEHYRNDSWVPLEIETTKGKVLYEDDEIRILWKAKLDLIADTGQGIFSVDHKTMSQRRDTLSLNNQFIGQCHVMGTRGVLINKIGFQKSLKPADKFTRVLISYSANRLLEWQSSILPYWVKLMLMFDESGYFPPNFTHCENKYGFCMFKGVCEADEHMREEELKLHFKVGSKWDV